jgi:hypothetical protein
MVDGDSIASELRIIWQIACDGSGKVDLPVFHHFHYQGGRELFCHRAEAEAGVRRIWSVPLHIGFAVALAQDGPPAFRD